MAQPPLCHWPPPGFILPLPPPGTPPAGHKYKVEGSAGGRGRGRVGSFNLLLGSLQNLSLHGPLPSSHHICTCSSLGPLYGGGGVLLISEVMENGACHTLQIGSDCLGVKGESFTELGGSGGVERGGGGLCWGRTANKSPCMCAGQGSGQKRRVSSSTIMSLACR